MSLTRCLLRTNGTREDLPEGMSITDLADAIGAECLTTVNLRHMGQPLHVLLVDDIGYRKHLPVNVQATALYLANCVPGATWKILGDAVVYPDDDFASGPGDCEP